MLYEVKEFFSSGEPTDDDILVLLDGVVKRESCMVNLWWNYYGRCEIHIRPGMTLENCRQQIHMAYPV